jgi:hypothetical protein
MKNVGEFQGVIHVADTHRTCLICIALNVSAVRSLTFLSCSCSFYSRAGYLRCHARPPQRCKPHPLPLKRSSVLVLLSRHAVCRFLRLINPLLVRSIAALLQLGSNNPLEQLADKAHKVMPPERVLPQPLGADILLLLETILVTELAGTDAQVTHAGHEVEANLVLGIAGNAAVQDVDDLGGELLGGTGAMRDGGGLQAVELVQGIVDGRVGDEVVDVVVLGGGALRLVDEGRRPGERVVCFTDEV